MKASIQFGQLVFAVMLLASATAFGGDVSAVSDGGRSVNDGFGRSSAMPSGTRKAVNSAGDVPGVQHIAGRASQIPGTKSAPVGYNGTDVTHFGRSSVNIAAGGTGGAERMAGLSQ